MFEQFPYSDMHQLNLDWIVKIAKDFLDQYTHLQELITTGEGSITDLTNDGLQQLAHKAEILEALLQSWYDTHIVDINTALTNAIEDFNEAADTKAETTIESIPADYTALFNDHMITKTALHGNYIPLNYNSPNGMVRNGITFTINADKSISATGDAGANAYFYIVHESQQRTLQPGHYVLMGLKTADRDPATMYIKVGSTTYTLRDDYIDFTVTQEEVYSLGFFVKANRSVSNLTVYPILYYYNDNLNYQPSYLRNDNIYDNLVNNYYKNLKTIGNTEDLNNYITNGIVQALSGSNSPLNTPFGTDACTVFVNQFATNFVNQFAIRWTDGKTSYRKFENNTWTAWNNIYVEEATLTNYYKNYGTLPDNADLDNIATNSIYQVLSGAHSPANNPFGTNSCTVITNIYSGANYINQLAIEWSTGRIAYRYRTGAGWQAWKYPTIGRNYAGKYYAFGDSVTWGYSSDHNHSQSPWNYPALVGNLTGVDVHNVADPGQGLLKDWSEGTTGNYAIIPTIEEMITNGDFANTTLITVGWAYNDASYYSNVDFGSPSDPIPASTTGITTWLGHYAKVMDMLQQAAPNALVVLVTGFGYTLDSDGHVVDQQFTKTRHFNDGDKTIREMYNALEEMANYNGYCCINQAKGSSITKGNGNTIIGTDHVHPTYQGYRIYGNNIASRIAALFQNL